MGNPQRRAFNQDIFQACWVVTMAADQPVGFGDGVGFAVPDGQVLKIGHLWPVGQTKVLGAGPTPVIDSVISLGEEERRLGRMQWCNVSMETASAYHRQQQDRREGGEKERGPTGHQAQHSAQFSNNAAGSWPIKPAHAGRIHA